MSGTSFLKLPRPVRDKTLLNKVMNAASDGIVCRLVGGNLVLWDRPDPGPRIHSGGRHAERNPCAFKDAGQALVRTGTRAELKCQHCGQPLNALRLLLQLCRRARRARRGILRPGTSHSAAITHDELCASI
jgi:hypothetical protein